MPRKNTIKKNPIRKTNKNNGRRLRKTKNVKQQLRKTMKKRGGAAPSRLERARKFIEARKNGAKTMLGMKRNTVPNNPSDPQDDNLKHLYNFLNTHMEANHDLVAVKKTAKGGQSDAGTYKAFILDIKREEKQSGGMFKSKKYEAKLENSDKYKLTEANLESYTEIAGNKINKLRSIVGMNGGGGALLKKEAIDDFQRRLDEIKTAFSAEKAKFNSGIDEHSSPEVKEDFFNTIIENLEGIIKDAEKLLEDIEEPMKAMLEQGEVSREGDAGAPGAGAAEVQTERPGPTRTGEETQEQKVERLKGEAQEARQAANQAGEKQKEVDQKIRELESKTNPPLTEPEEQQLAQLKEEIPGLVQAAEEAERVFNEAQTALAAAKALEEAKAAEGAEGPAV